MENVTATHKEFIFFQVFSPQRLPAIKYCRLCCSETEKLIPKCKLFSIHQTDNAKRKQSGSYYSPPHSNEVSLDHCYFTIAIATQHAHILIQSAGETLYASRTEDSLSLNFR